MPALFPSRPRAATPAAPPGRAAPLAFSVKANMTILPPVRNGVDIRRTEFACTVPAAHARARWPAPPGECGHPRPSRAQGGAAAKGPTRAEDAADFCAECNALFMRGLPCLEDGECSEEDEVEAPGSPVAAVWDGPALAALPGQGRRAAEEESLLPACKADSGVDLSSDGEREAYGRALAAGHADEALACRPLQ